MYDKVFVLKNYNKFLFNDGTWNDLYIHRFKQDFRRLKKFKNVTEASEYLERNPNLEKDFDAWIVETGISKWS